MAKKAESWKPVAGLVLRDAEDAGRVVRLVYRFDPTGKDIPPYWVVKNLATGEESTVRESELHKRYDLAEKPITTDAEAAADEHADDDPDTVARLAELRQPVVVNDPNAVQPDEQTIQTIESGDGGA